MDLGKDLLFRILSSSSATIIHSAAKPNDLLDSILRQMISLLHDSSYLLENRKILLFLRRQETKSFKKGNHIRDDGSCIVHLVIPNPVFPFPQGSAFQTPLEQRQDHLVFLRNIEAQGNLPRHRVVLAFSERNIEASLAIGESCKIIADGRGNLVYELFSPFIHFGTFPADCPHLTDCHCPLAGRVPEDTPEFPAFSQVYLRNYNGQIIVTAAVYWGFSSVLRGPKTANTSL